MAVILKEGELFRLGFDLKPKEPIKTNINTKGAFKERPRLKTGKLNRRDLRDNPNNIIARERAMAHIEKIQRATEWALKHPEKVDAQIRRIGQILSEFNRKRRQKHH